MTDLAKRLEAAWAILRGRPVIRGVAIDRGEVTIGANGNLLVSRGAITGCQIWTRGPVVIRADGTSYVGDNTGDALSIASCENRP